MGQVSVTSPVLLCSPSSLHITLKNTSQDYLVVRACTIEKQLPDLPPPKVDPEIIGTPIGAINLGDITPPPSLQDVQKKIIVPKTMAHIWFIDKNGTTKASFAIDEQLFTDMGKHNAGLEHTTGVSGGGTLIQVHQFIGGFI